MTCFMCKGSTREGVSNFTADLDDGIVVVKNVPSLVCEQCGEVSFSDEVARQLERIVTSARKAVNTEIAVLKYSKAA